MRTRFRIKLDPMKEEDMVWAKDKVKRARKALTAYTSREVQERARQAALDAIDTLHAIILSPVAADQAKISAANTIFERAYGKVAQTNVNANISDVTTKNIDGKSLEQRIAETLSRIEGAESREGEEAQSEGGASDLRKLN